MNVIEHVVIFKIKPETPPHKISSMTDALNNLKWLIPQLTEMHAGINFSPRNKGFEVMLVSRFKSREDLKIYMDHPEHKKVIDTYIHPIREDLIVGDLEF